MRQTLAVPNTGMAITIDIGEANDIHPKNKQDVGKRLALWALGTTYGKSLVISGPLHQAMSVEDGKIAIRFDHVGEGLKAAGDQLLGFAIAGEDRKFVFAQAEITGPDTVVVSSPEVARPVAVRYAWAANPNANLFNSADLPASPFRTDSWDNP
jgi:sialate O-acetylesterase